MNGILWILRTGSPWRDLPPAFGPWQTVWRLFDQWNHDGTLDAILQELQGEVEINEELWCIDGAVVRAARCAAGGGKKKDADEPQDHAIGRSRGGLSTKIHLLCDRDAHPLTFALSAGQRHESTMLEAVLTNADEGLFDAEGEPIAWPVALAGDKGYRAEWIDGYLLELGMKPVIPSKENEDREARAVPFDKQAYRDRNIVERLIGWLKECRRIFSRFEKTAKNFTGMIKMAFIQRYLRTT